MVKFREVFTRMDILRILCVGMLVLGLTNCRKKTDTVASELKEAGHELTAESWFGAIRGNDVVVMKKMVGGGFDEKTTDASGSSGLHVAAEHSSREAAEYLLNRGFSVDEKTGSGLTPLMHAVLADQPEMVKWLLRQGADPKLKDNEGFIALMHGVTKGRRQAVEELAPYYREDLDSALLLAALVGQTEVIDALTNYGASVYARMEDGRTPLMLAAQNGHREAAALLIDIGASRFATSEDGHTAQSLAVSAGNQEIATMIETGSVDDRLALESDEEVAEVMNGYLEEFETAGEESGAVAAIEEGESGLALTSERGSVAEGSAATMIETIEVASLSGGADGGPVVTAVTGTEERSPRSLDGATISRTPAPHEAGEPAGLGRVAQRPRAASEEFPLVMRHYRQRELPVEVKEVSGGVAALRLAGPEPQEVRLEAGEKIPGSSLVLVRVYSRVEQGKMNGGESIEIGVVEVEDQQTGQRRDWMAGQPAVSHDPLAMVEDAVTGRRYLAKPGQMFHSEGGRQFVVSDVRPNQVVIEETATGEVRTLGLRGPKG